MSTTDTRSAPTRDGRARVLRPGDLRDANEIAVLRELIAAGPRSRSELAVAVGLTQAPVTRLVARLTDRGVLRETVATARDGEPAGRGRPAVPVELVSEAETVVGVHIGLDRLVMGRAGLDGRVTHRRRAGHRNSWATVRRLVVDYVAETEAFTGRGVLAVGVIVGGIVDPTGGRLIDHPSLGWSDLAIADELSTRLDRRVVIEASVRAQARADLLFGVAPRAADFVHVFVGRLVEVAVVGDGRVRVGRDGLGCDVTDWTMTDPLDPDGPPAPVTEVIGDRRLLARAAAAGVIGADDYVDALVAAAGEDGPARSLLWERAAAVGELLARLDAVHSPHAFVVNGSVTSVPGAHDRLVASLREHRPGVPTLPEVMAPQYSKDALVASAVAVALERTVLTGSDTDA